MEIWEYLGMVFDMGMMIFGVWVFKYYNIWKPKQKYYQNLPIGNLFDFSGFQTKMVFKQSFKYLTNEKINFIKMILKLECLFYQNMYILFHLIFYSVSHFDSNKSKKSSNSKKKLAISSSVKLSLRFAYFYPSLPPPPMG